MTRKHAIDPAVLAHNTDAALGVLKGLSNKSRLLIMCALYQGELSVSELNERVTVSQSALSQHLAILREHGLVHSRRQAQTVYYSLTESTALDIIRLLHDELRNR
jgi:DNA-binding transcriptional ArsR family regulator